MEELRAAEKDAEIAEAATRRMAAMNADQKTFKPEVLGLSKVDRDKLISKMMLSDVEKVELIQAVRNNSCPPPPQSLIHFVCFFLFFLVNWGHWWVIRSNPCTEGTEARHQRPLESVASYLCYKKKSCLRAPFRCRVIIY